MNKVLRFFKDYPIVGITLVIAAVSGILQLSGLMLAGRIIITVFVAAFSLYTLFDMIKQILRRHFGLDILALVAMVSTLLVGEYWASIIIVLMLSGGEALEDYAAHRAKRELTSLLDRTPTEAHLVTEGNQTTDISVDEVTPGQILLVRPAEVVPVDAALVSEAAEFDESSITGESLPISLVTGQEVPSGSVNGDLAVKVRALRPAAESQYQQIVHLVQEAEDSKAPVVRLADRFAMPFTAVSLLIAAIAWIVSKDPVRFAEVLVLATPCPLLIAAPVAFLGGMSRAARAGIIVKGGAVLEQAAEVKSAAFDKTGTLTEGKPQVVALRSASEATDEELLHLAASAEQYSAHVLAEGIRAHAEQNGVQLQNADDAKEIPAKGVEATLDGQTVRVGQFKFVSEVVEGAVEVHLEAGQVAVYASHGGRFLGAVILSDKLRPEAAAVSQWLHENGVSNQVMVTGDGQKTADSIAAQVGIDHVYAGLHPVDKVKIVKGLHPKPTMMVGDGINDAPVLAASDIGVAMGAKGSTAAGEAADAVILKDSLAPLADLVSIAKHTLRVGLTSIWLGIVLSIVLMLVATTGVIPAVAGAFTQEILDLVAILYALRALGGQLPRLPHEKEKQPQQMHG